MRTDANSKPTWRKAAPPVPHPNHRAVQARLLDRQADAELFLGHAAAAERLAHAAADLRESGL